jgi:hypothetical protein
MMGRVFTSADLVGKARFNAKELLGRTCMIKVDHEEKNGKTYSKIANLIQTPEGIPEPAQLNECVYFSLAPGEFSESVFESLSSWTREKIQSSEGFSNLMATPPKESKPSASAYGSRATADLDDEIPW